MDGWRDGRTDRPTDRSTDRWIDGCWKFVRSMLKIYIICLLFVVNVLKDFCSLVLFWDTYNNNRTPHLFSHKEPRCVVFFSHRDGSMQLLLFLAASYPVMYLRSQVTRSSLPLSLTVYNKVNMLRWYITCDLICVPVFAYLIQGR